jgi:subtilisin-like proprotein convertase family protein
MQSRLSSTYRLCVLTIGLMAWTSSSATAAEAPNLNPIQGSYELQISGSQAVYDLALDELMVIDQNNRGQLQQIAAQANAPAIEQLAATMEAASGSRVRLVMYPRGYARHSATQIHISREIIAELNVSVDPLAVAAASGTVYRGELSYMRGHHVYQTASASDSLRTIPVLAGIAGVGKVIPNVGRVTQPMFVPNDPLFTNQWHLLNIGQQGALPGSDVNITNAWENYLGSNIVIGVFDAGFELTHPDLAPNFITNAAFNVNDDSQDVLPTLGDTEDFHGTAVSGVAAARGNNGIGLTGSAPLASIIPIKVDFATALINDYAQGISHSNNVIDVHNNSWGPGAAFLFLSSWVGPVSNALYNGKVFGRNGRGTIYMFAAGNSGEQQDDVNYSELANTMNTIAVAALNDLDARANYSTPGAALLISAPSGLETSANGRRQGTSTTDQLGTNGYNNTFSFPLGDYTNRDYTANFNGTSSATPLASGVVALMLQANTNLGWRDVQEIIIQTAAKNDTNHFDWATNAAGFHFNHEYGAGRINADGATTMAATWTNLSLQTNISMAVSNLQAVVTDSTPVTQTFTFTDAEFRIEHMQLSVDISHPLRGDLQIAVTSPSGMRSVLARTHSDFNPDYNWTFLSTRHWGEIAAGDWTVEVSDQRFGANGIVNNLELMLWGTISNATFNSLTNPPAVMAHPLSRTATKGSATFFRVDATGSGQLNYRWLFNGNELAGQNTKNLILSDVGPQQQGTYAVRIDNQFGNIVSAGASLFVNSPPEITTGPAATSALIGGAANFTVAAIGNSPLSYQWRHNGNVITNATLSTLTLTNIQPGQIGDYDVVIRNPISSIISLPASLASLQGVSFNTVVAPTGSGPFSFNFTGTTGLTVRIDGSSNLTNWTALATNVISTGTGSFSDSAAASLTNRYYRVVPLP